MLYGQGAFQNRAVEDDEVAVRVLPISKWYTQQSVAASIAEAKAGGAAGGSGNGRASAAAGSLLAAPAASPSLDKAMSGGDLAWSLGPAAAVQALVRSRDAFAYVLLWSCYSAFVRVENEVPSIRNQRASALGTLKIRNVCDVILHPRSGRQWLKCMQIMGRCCHALP